MNVPMNVPKNDGERPAAAVGFWNENLTSAETVAVAKLIALGFERLDAIAQTRRRGPDQVEIAIANSESIEASGDLLSRRGYIVKCIREGWPPRENDPVAKARKKAAERAEQQRLRDQSIAARRNESERLKHEIDAGLIELWAFIDGLPPGRFESISTQVLRAKPHVAPKDGRDPRRHSPLCRQVKAWLEGSFIAAPVVPRSDLRVPQSVEAASC